MSRAGTISVGRRQVGCSLLLLLMAALSVCARAPGSAPRVRRPRLRPGPVKLKPRPRRGVPPAVQPAAQRPPIFVCIIMHNEGPKPPIWPDFVSDTAAFVAHRGAVIRFAQMVKACGAKLNFQSDWSFLAAEKARELALLHKGAGTLPAPRRSRGRGGPGAGTEYGKRVPASKNLVRYLTEDLGFEVDPHTHSAQHGRNYADVAYLLKSLGVTPSCTVGGFIAWPPGASELEQFWAPVTGQHYAYQWTATLLSGAGTHDHQDEGLLVRSGIWRPRSRLAPTEHAADAPLPMIGAYGAAPPEVGPKTTNWNALKHLLWLRARGMLTYGRIYTCTLFVGQKWLVEEPGFTDRFEARLRGLMHEPRLRWVGLAELLGIWQTDYNAQPCIFRVPSQIPAELP